MKYSKIILSALYLILPFFALAVEGERHPYCPGTPSLTFATEENRQNTRLSQSNLWTMMQEANSLYSSEISPRSSPKRPSISYSLAHYAASSVEAREDQDASPRAGWIHEEANNQEVQMEVRHLKDNIFINGLRTKKEIKREKYKKILYKLKAKISILTHVGNTLNGSIYSHSKILFYNCHFDKRLIKDIGCILNPHEMLSMEILFIKCTYPEDLEKFIQTKLFFGKKYIQCTKIIKKKRRNWNCMGQACVS